MRKAVEIILIVVGVFCSNALLAQNKEKKREEIYLDGNRFWKYNNWLNIGLGVGQKFNSKKISMPLGIAYNFHIKKQYFKAGFMRSEVKGMFKPASESVLNDLHFCYGKRTENQQYNFAGFVGISKVGGREDTGKRFSTVGAYAEIQLTKKIVYDVGIGTTLFFNYNRHYPITGVRLDLYFSNAYRGKINE